MFDVDLCCSDVDCLVHPLLGFNCSLLFECCLMLIVGIVFVIYMCCWLQCCCVGVVEFTC